jgi:VWFA-related protein
MNPDIAVLQDYTTDHDALLAAVRAFQPHQPVWSSTPTSGPRASTYSAENREVQSKPQGAAAGARGRGNPAVRNMNAFFLDQRILATVAALKAIATQMSGASHRNSIIWITAGLPANLETNQQMLAAIQAINDANVAVYPVDARGLPVGGIDSNIQIMDGIAENTGGVAYTMSNDVAQEIQDAIAAPGYTYLLGFYLSRADLDGKLHRLHVSVDRPGVSLNYRSGYTAYADPNTARADAEPLESELLSPSDSTAIGIDGKVTVQNSPAGKQLHIEIVLDRARLPYAPNTKVTLSQMFVELDAQGRVIGKVTADIKFDMPGVGRKPAYSQTIRDQDGAKKLRVVLQDKNSKRTGSLTIPL